MSVVLPRLDRDQAAALIAAARTVDSPADISARLPDTTVDTVWPAVGDARISDATLTSLRTWLLYLAAQHDFPGPGRQLTAFDAAAARLIHTTLDLSPHEASHEGAWTYLTCCWLLDIAVWRFGTRTDTDRFLGHVNRNTFRRLWWRAEILGDDVDLSRLGEDELFNIMERPTLTADPFVAQTLANEFLSVIDTRPGIPRTQLMREATKRLLRLTPFVDLTYLDDQQLIDRVRACFDQATAAMTGETVTEPARMASIPPRTVAPSSAVSVITRITLTEDPATVADYVFPVSVEATAGNRVLDRTVAGIDGTSSGEDAASAPLSADQVGLIASDLAARTGRVTNQTLRDALGISREDALRVLTRETQRGSLVRHGARRGTYYSLPSAGQTTADLERTTPETKGDASGVILGGRGSSTVLRRLLNRRP